ncbi:uncharacterized protein L199_004733 [Kwoniella botswanensis]|uniref:uncharacterized protein n=1 Tax=Kwoniella botswanensis TaxID=1268659 RepID=UPI00315CECBC
MHASIQANRSVVTIKTVTASGTAEAAESRSSDPKNDIVSASLPPCILAKANIDTNPFKRITGMDGRELYTRIIDAKAVELMTPTGGEWTDRLISKDRADKRLMEKNQGTIQIKRPGNGISKFAYKVLMPDTAWYEARQEQGLKYGEGGVKEDRGDDDVMLFSVFDGHSGSGTAQLLKTAFHACLAYALGQAKLYSDDVMNYPERVAQIIKSSFNAIDDDIVQAPLKLLYPELEYKLSGCLPPQPPSKLCGPELIPSGSCALNMIYDATSRRVYVANCGDCRAVAGWWNPKEKKWRCDILTEDHNGHNPKECDRIDNEHPEEERGHIMKPVPEMRMFGQLQPTRVFGDHAYKWRYDDWVEQESPQRTFKKEDRKFRKTPPYATAEPEVVWRDLHANEEEELKFVILATDGLWGRMTSEEAFLLTATTYNYSKLHNRQIHDKNQIMEKFFPGFLEKIDWGDHPFPTEQLELEGSWDLRNENAPTRLVRNAYGGNDVLARRQILSMGHDVKQIRDDTTVLVVHFGVDLPKE